MTSSPVVAQAPKPTAAAESEHAVLKTIYRRSEAQFQQYWTAKVFREEVTAGPRIAYSNEMATDLAAAIPGAVAFVETSHVPKGLKVLKIDGVLPGDKGYALAPASPDSR